MPESRDSLVPLPSRHRRAGGVHVADRRVAGLHRAAGLTGPTTRYTVIVVMLATMSSLPIIAAISAGSASVGDSVDASGTTPFIPPPSEGPVVVPPLLPPALPAEVPVPAGVAEQLRAVAPERAAGQPSPLRKTKRPVWGTGAAPAPSATEPVEPTKPPTPPTPSPSPTPSPWPPLAPTWPYLSPSATPSVTPSVVASAGLPSCAPDLDGCLSDQGASVRP